jgi:transcriptional regulator with XRE-family HTH domain
MTPARDPIEIARTIKLLREMHNMKATTLAEFSGLTLRSIERAESGRHRLSEQALQQIAQAFKVSVTVFDPFDLVDPVTLRKAYENSAKKMVLVPAVPFKNTAEVMGMIGETVGYWHDLSSIQDDAALDAATEFMQAFIDTKDLWDSARARAA